MPNSHSQQCRFYNHSLALLIDLYQLTMSYGYWKAGLDKKEAVFHLFFRRQTFQGGFTIAAGLESVIDYFNHFRFDDSDLAYLASLRGDDDTLLFEPVHSFSPLVLLVSQHGASLCVCVWKTIIM